MTVQREQSSGNGEQGRGRQVMQGRAALRARVPVMLQLSAVECGPVCLAMLLSYHGRRETVAGCRARCGVGRDGTTALTLVEVGRSYGLLMRAFSVDPGALGRLSPAIVHWEFNHFLVVERWTPRRVTVVDPAVGRRELNAAEFDAGFTGVVITAEPGPAFVREPATAPPAWRGYLATAIGSPGLLSQVVGASLLLQLFGLALPAVTKLLVDRVILPGAASFPATLAVGMAALVLAQLLASYLRAVLLLALQARVDTSLTLGFFEHLLRLPFGFFEQRSSGDLIMRIASSAQIRELLTAQTLSVFLDGSLMLVYLAILLAQAPGLAAVVLGVGALQLALLLGTGRRARELAQRDLVAQADAQGYLVEALAGIATLKSAGAERHAGAWWQQLFTRQLNTTLERGYLAALIDAALLALSTAAPLILLWLGLQQVLDGSISLGTMLALNVVAVAVLTPLAELVTSAERFLLVGAYLERIADVLEAEPEQDREQVRPAPALRGEIELDRVSFRYHRHGPAVLRDISLTIRAGQTVALVGRTGSGKSSLARLLIGLYSPSEGSIRYDGHDLRELDHSSLRAQCGVVLQEPFLFAGSIRQNIALHNPALLFDEVVVAARLAAVDDEIMRMPLGYETLVAEGGASLSGGQRQRLALARALVGRPAILVLDEATSQLDALTERDVEASVGGLPCTRVIVAHRLSTVVKADLIVVLDQGAIVEQGTHAELLARDGLYAALVGGRQGPSGAPSIHG